MGFRLGDIAEHTESGNLKGIQREIACECWFTSKGKTMPQLIKVMDDKGVLHTIRDIDVITSEEKTYSGIQTIEHTCKIEVFGRTHLVKLIFRKDTCRWTIVVH